MEAPEFVKAAIGAFPSSCAAQAERAAGTLLSSVDDSYRQQSIEVHILGENLRIPKRIHFLGLDEHFSWDPSPMVPCLCSRSTDGYLRQAALRRLSNAHEPWVAPFVVLLAGEYVVEILNDLVALTPDLNRETYSAFVRENRPMMRRLRRNAISYWDCYYREMHPDRSRYPGLVFLNQIEGWAS